MFNPKRVTIETPSNAEALFGPEAERSWAVRTERAAQPAAMPEVAPSGQEAQQQPLERKSYRILRGRIEPLSKLRLVSRQGEMALIDYGCITWVNVRSPGELVLRVNDGEPYTVTISGRGLAGELLDGLQDEKVEWIGELNELEAAQAARTASEGEGVVTGIWIKEGSVSREWSRGGQKR
jgi:hypothetical protein